MIMVVIYRDSSCKINILFFTLRGNLSVCFYCVAIYVDHFLLLNVFDSVAEINLIRLIIYKAYIINSIVLLHGHFSYWVVETVGMKYSIFRSQFRKEGC